MAYDARVRKACSSDTAGIAKVQVTAWQAAYRGLLPDDTLDRLTVESVQKRWEERLAAPTGEYLVLIDGGQLGRRAA